MLTAMRRLAGTWLAKVLFVLLILSFAVWGIEDMVRNFGRDTAVARVGGQAIEMEEAQTAARRELARLSRQLGQTFEADENIRRAVTAQALEALVQDRVMRLEAQRERILVPEQAVREFIFSIPGLRGPDGRFSRPVFDSFLRTNDLTEPRFLDLVRQELARQQLAGAVRSGAGAPPALARPLLAWTREGRSADIAFFDIAEAPEPEPPTEAQLRRFHENNPDRFSTPEYRDVAIAVLVTRNLTNDVQVTEEQIAEAYAARRTQFVTPERRAFRQVVVPSEDAARAIATNWRGGATEEQIAEQAREAGGQAIEVP
ncbi:MAG TPA: peptidylprolyl isomerase, partial [Acetobacteraceae bacterium]|nr:peptidylprolyl isomerase [Acetobacteraceae bacterium]